MKYKFSTFKFLASILKIYAREFKFIRRKTEMKMWAQNTYGPLLRAYCYWPIVTGLLLLASSIRN
jgi:hypothetical protein